VPARFDHVTLSTPDLGAAVAFYDATLGALGLSRVIELVDEEEDDAEIEAVAWGSDETAAVWVVAGPPTSNVHLRFAAASRAEVEAFHAAGLAAGGTSGSAPRRWPIYRRGEFNAVLRDPGGNSVEAVSTE
jgi:catechol 2,3-dioxygenase-like lactoylglutathione lyase family enzyme